MLQPAISHTQDQEVPGLQRESQAKFAMDKQLLFEKHYSPQQIAASGDVLADSFVSYFRTSREYRRSIVPRKCISAATHLSGFPSL